MVRLLEILLLIWAVSFIVIRLIELFAGKKVCDFLGHEWERTNIQTHLKKGKHLEVHATYKCKNCGKIKKEITYE